MISVSRGERKVELILDDVTVDDLRDWEYRVARIDERLANLLYLLRIAQEANEGEQT